MFVTRRKLLALVASQSVALDAMERVCEEHRLLQDSTITLAAALLRALDVGALTLDEAVLMLYEGIEHRLFDFDEVDDGATA